MSHVYSDENGTYLVKLARQTVDGYVTKKIKPEVPDDVPKALTAKSGVFVTLNSVTGEHVELRGCIGRPYPTQPLVEATIDSAVDASTNDPRFPPVTQRELDNILVELSILTPPKKINWSKPKELMDSVKIGRDGLIASRGMWRGLLLPQVPVEWGWDTKQFLEHTCNKAGLPLDAWKDTKTEFMSFQAEIFGEETPKGGILRDPVHARC
ncbi:MAG: TIGR00296 family protein [Candidatus Thorarchaeota archaeon]|nr:MAG: TIGR00296 family protein [Candidatus Thorarchaeota archaeon]